MKIKQINKHSVLLRFGTPFFTDSLRINMNSSCEMPEGYKLPFEVSIKNKQIIINRLLTKS